MGNEKQHFRNSDSHADRQITRKTQEILRARSMLAALTVIMSIAGSDASAGATKQQIKETQEGAQAGVRGNQGLSDKPADPATKSGSSTTKNENASGGSGPDPTEEIHYARSLSRAFREVSKRVGPSVVAITTIDRAPFSNEFGRSSPRTTHDDPRIPQSIPQSIPRGSERRGDGTGIILSDDGLIITNNHVVAGGDEILVRLSDGREMAATKVGADPETDLAVIRIDATGLHAVTFGDSNAIETGDWVLAIGCPFGLEHTVTAGIVSAKGRSGVGLSTFEEYIQTDAAINPGNSGGPLIDLDGKVIGINSGIASQTGGNLGVGFAIPSHIVQRVADSIAHGRAVRRGWLGISMQGLDHDLAKSFGRDSNDGVLVSGIVRGTPAAHAGLEVGDIIVAIDGKTTQTPAEFLRTIANFAPNTSVTLGLIRGGKSITADATLGERPSSTMTESTPKPVSSDIEESLGLEIRALDRDSATAFGETGQGVSVVSTLEGGPAAMAGMAPNDIIREVNGITITDVESCRAALAKLKDAQVIRILFDRDGRIRFTLVKRLP